PPRSTLFPTRRSSDLSFAIVQRSIAVVHDLVVFAPERIVRTALEIAVRVVAFRDAVSVGPHVFAFFELAVLVVRASLQEHSPVLDRKSTRLNSSHVKI